MATETTAGRLRLSDIAPGTAQSEIRAMSALCDQAGGVNLAQGICDTEPPPVVLEGAARAIRDGRNIYTRMEGIARLRLAIADQVARTHGLAVDPEREVLITSGATGAFHAAAMALLNPGDEVLLFEPLYGYHATTLRTLRVKPVIVALDWADWAVNLDAVRAAVTPRTRAVVINTPSNPAGKVFTRAELEGLGEIAAEHDLFILTDEIYEHFVYDGRRHVSPAEIPGLRERTVLMSGFSKTFSVTGWRVGYLIADAKWIGAIAYFHDLTFICAPAPLQHGVADGVEQLGPAFYRGLADDHERKRGLLVDALRDAGMTPRVPDGAYYILAESGSLAGRTAAEKARSLLETTGVAAVAGSAFFVDGRGENLLRLCFAKKDADLAEACRRLRTLGPVKGIQGQV
jgi:aminotransferase